MEGLFPSEPAHLQHLYHEELHYPDFGSLWNKWWNWWYRCHVLQKAHCTEKSVSLCPSLVILVLDPLPILSQLSLHVTSILLPIWL